MKVYNYDRLSSKYIGYQEADKDPEETLKKGEFVPLVPAYATLIKPPTCLKDEIQVFDKEQQTWNIIKKEVK